MNTSPIASRPTLPYSLAMRLYPIAITVMLEICALIGASAGQRLQAAIAYGHPELVESRLAEQRLRDLLLGRSNTWQDGSPVVLVLARDEASTEAVRQLTGMDLRRLLRGWKRLVFAGNGAMPLVVESPEAAVAMVLGHPGALCVIGDPQPASATLVLYADPEPPTPPSPPSPEEDLAPTTEKETDHAP